MPRVYHAHCLRVEVQLIIHVGVRYGAGKKKAAEDRACFDAVLDSPSKTVAPSKSVDSTDFDAAPTAGSVPPTPSGNAPLRPGVAFQVPEDVKG